MASAYDKASLVMLPNAYKDGKVYSVKPEDRSGDFTFTRSTAATRVNAAGNIEKETGNLLLQSNQFDTTWTNARSSEASGQSGYDGTSDAWLLQSTVSAISSYLKQNISNSGVYTMSVYAKAGTSDWMSLNTAGSQFAFFDLANGVLGSKSSNVVDSGIESIGNGWHRCSATLVGNNDFYIFIANGNNNSITNSGDNIYIQDAQLEQSLVARDYIETTTSAVYGGITDNVPRLDYSNGATCPSLLLEPQRTNFINFSEYYGQYSSTRSTITDNYGISPDGSQNAAAVFNTNDNGRHNFGGNYFAVTSGTSYVNSVFAKAGTITKMKLKLFSGGGSPIGFNDGDFDLTNGTATGTGAGIESYGNGWYRCYVVDSPTSSVSNTRFNLELLNASGGVSYVGSVTDYIEIFGSQVEQGSYPTSYIPTYGSSVSRVADDTNALNYDGNFNSITAFVHIKGDALLRDTTAANIMISATASQDSSIRIYRSSGSEDRRLSVIVRNLSASNNISYQATTDEVKFAVRYDSTTGNWELFENGVSVRTNTNNNYNEFKVFRLKGESGTVELNQMVVFPTALTDSECIALTTI